MESQNLIIKSLSFRILSIVLLCACSKAASVFAVDDPDPERWLEQMKLFNLENEKAPAPEGAVLCVGSSSMRMWHGRIADDLYPLTVIRRGFGGSQLSDVNYYFDELVTKYKPRAIVIYEGDNDVTVGKSPKRVFKDFMEFREKVKELDPSIRIYVIGIKPSPSRWNLKKKIVATNRLIKRECKSDDALVYIDVFSSLLDNKGKPHPEIFVEDGVHLNNIGYNLWAAAVGLTLIPSEKEFEGK